ncbi:MAG: O-antigen ligase family protein [Cyanobacteria bacterium P01_E01_bin.45]
MSLPPRLRLALIQLIEGMQTALPPDASGTRPKIDLETAFTIFSLVFYMNPVLLTVLGRDAATKVQQPTFLLIYALTFYFMYRHRHRYGSLIKSGGLLWVVVFIPLLSTLWSPFPDVTLRRAFAVVNTSLFGVYMGGRYNLKEILYLLRYVFVIIGGLSLIFAVVFPSWGLMQDLHAGAFRGVFIHKNSAAVRLSTGVIVFLVLTFSGEGSRLFNGIWTLLIFGMVTASQSSTGLGACILSFASIPFLLIPRGKLSQMLPAIFGTLLLAFLGGMFLLENTGTVLEAFGEDSQLTGRANFWPVLLESIYQRFWLGYGYEGYWAGGLNGPSAILAQLATTNAKTHAHNGYLETMLSVGFLGLFCLIVNLWSSILNFLKYVRHTTGFLALFPILFMVQFFAANMVETSVYGYNNFTWVIYVCLITCAIYDRAVMSLYSPKPEPEPVPPGLPIMDMDVGIDMEPEPVKL